MIEFINDMFASTSPKQLIYLTDMVNKLPVLEDAYEYNELKLDLIVELHNMMDEGFLEHKYLLCDENGVVDTTHEYDEPTDISDEVIKHNPKSNIKCAFRLIKKD